MAVGRCGYEMANRAAVESIPPDRPVFLKQLVTSQLGEDSDSTMNKSALVISDTAQISYIAGQPFADRCLRELGYLPYRVLSQPASTSLVFLPMEESLEQDPMDPLDP